MSSRILIVGDGGSGKILFTEDYHNTAVEILTELKTILTDTVISINEILTSVCDVFKEYYSQDSIEKRRYMHELRVNSRHNDRSIKRMISEINRRANININKSIGVKLHPRHYCK